MKCRQGGVDGQGGLGAVPDTTSSKQAANAVSVRVR
jgi:hypothetical protein